MNSKEILKNLIQKYQQYKNDNKSLELFMIAQQVIVPGDSTKMLMAFF